MKILNLTLDGIFMFNKCKYNLYTNKKINNLYKSDEINNHVSNIYSRDVNVIIGGNASGKSTLSKSMLLIQRLLRGFQLSDMEINVLKEEFELEMMYLMTYEGVDYVFEYKIYGKKNSICETLKYETFKKNEYISNRKKKKKKIDNLILISEEKFNFDKAVGLQSKIFSSESDELLVDLASGMGYIYSTSDFGNVHTTQPKKKIPKDKLVTFLKVIDKSIENVKYTDKEKMDFYIIFKSGEELLVDHDNLKLSGKRLSYGTVEAIIFFFKVYSILDGRYNVVFIDEELSHVHSELEKVLLLSLISNIPSDVQLFFTTHNLELLKINLPISCYTIISEDENGNSRITLAENFIKHRYDRTWLYKHVTSNFLDTEKDYDEIFDLFNEVNNE